ncbi:MAG: hypothetical protein DMF63_01400 [Acidobacteria bacterium]|nr:MAG: hypothetical protein DMF63_01400 [Acidobacteriota bacterium]
MRSLRDAKKDFLALIPMAEPAANYASLDLQKRFHAQAIRVWLITAAVVLVWLAAIVAAPLLPQSNLSASIYTFFSYICHQIGERSLHLAGHQLAVCSRCFGVYFGLLAGILIYPLWRPIAEIEPIPRFWLFVSLIPITIDWSLTISGIWENTHLSRFVTGMILGATCATYIVPAVVEIVRNLSSRRIKHS